MKKKCVPKVSARYRWRSTQVNSALPSLDALTLTPSAHPPPHRQVCHDLDAGCKQNACDPGDTRRCVDCRFGYTLNATTGRVRPEEKGGACSVLWDART